MSPKRTTDLLRASPTLFQLGIRENVGNWITREENFQQRYCMQLSKRRAHLLIGATLLLQFHNIFQIPKTDLLLQNRYITKNYVLGLCISCKTKQYNHVSYIYVYTTTYNVPFLQRIMIRVSYFSSWLSRGLRHSKVIHRPYSAGDTTKKVKLIILRKQILGSTGCYECEMSDIGPFFF